MLRQGQCAPAAHGAILGLDCRLYAGTVFRVLVVSELQHLPSPLPVVAPVGAHAQPAAPQGEQEVQLLFDDQEDESYDSQAVQGTPPPRPQPTDRDEPI